MSVEVQTYAMHTCGLRWFSLGAQACTLPSLPLIFKAGCWAGPPASPHPPASIPPPPSLSPHILGPLMRGGQLTRPLQLLLTPWSQHSLKELGPPVHALSITPRSLTRPRAGAGRPEFWWTGCGLGVAQCALPVPASWPSAGSRESRGSSCHLAVPTPECANTCGRAKPGPFLVTAQPFVPRVPSRGSQGTMCHRCSPQA